MALIALPPAGRRLDAAPAPTGVRPGGGEAEEAETLLVGIYYNGTLQDETIVYRSRGEYWIGFDSFLQKSGLQEEGRTGELVRYPTNLGTLTFDSSALRSFDSEECISFSALKRVFLARPAFDPSLFAVMLDIPWRPGSGSKQRGEEPDIKAPSGTISYIGIEARTDFDFDDEPLKNLLLESSGRALKGVWSVTATGDPGERMTPSRYNWTTFNRHTALRLGTGYSGTHSLIGSAAMTGAQFGWNSRSIVGRLDAEQGWGSETFLNFDTNQLRTLEGTAPPGGIAELRFDGEVVARQRIRLDGMFSFANVRMDSDLRRTEVRIYERSLNENPLKIVDFSQSLATRSLPGGEIMVRGGIGRSGNILDGREGSTRKTEAFTSVLYGISRRVTLEEAYQQKTETGSADLLSGAVLSIGRNWTAALYGASSNRRYGADVRFQGTYRHWDLSYWGTGREAGYVSAEQSRRASHSMRWTLRAADGVSLQAIGRRETGDDSLAYSYLLPAANLSPFGWWRLAATPHDDRTYRYETGLRLGGSDRVTGILDRGVLSIDYRHDLSRELNLSLANDYAFSTADAITNLGFDWYPAGGSRQNVSTLFSYSKGAFGLSGSLARYLNTGLRVAMQYSFNMNNAANLSTSQLVPIAGAADARRVVALTLSWDLGWSQRGFIPINRNEVTLTRGALAGSLDVDREATLPASDINDIRILLNGRSLQQRQVNGDFFVGRLRPGIYRVSIDRENLPIELVAEQKEMLVEIKNGAVTGMKIPLHAEYGAAGRVCGENGEGISGALVSIRSEKGEIVAATRTNRFGYFRSDGLKNGSYKAVAESGDGSSAGSERAFSIEGDYLFGLDLTIKMP
ncbi:carboxypeptidase-like regulatory domain-containing protein [Chlorobium sp. N1]|uniref:carboxypeptidase-like regulatory domain-containing protein n=1 Tax=Chlorobium sp. N1 TaxID=2491138 RepID=UPI00103BCC06|nr:carboxypeptidase-like regulatory domain-containing protein [Chlorobium sp. N1]TCD47428.1 carboxypeptidase regulatory-like domain-containing protein [Chlorobium sp. N1]